MPMVSLPFTGSVSQYWNTSLRKLKVLVKAEDGTESVVASKIKVLPTSGFYDAYATYEDVEAAGELPSRAAILKWRNDKLLAAAKAKAALKAVTDAGFIEPTAENDPLLQLKGFYTMYYANLKSRNPGMAEDELVARARAKAADESGIAWPDNTEDED